MTDGPVHRGGLREGVATALRQDIAEGRAPLGDRLPSEADLARRFGVNRHTVREALARLAADGLVFSRRGAGHFVAARPADYPIGRRVRFTQNVRAAGRTPSRRVLSIATRPLDAAEAEGLGLPEGAMGHAYEGVSLASGQPLALFLSVFPAERLVDLPARLVELESVTAALAACGIADYTRSSTRLVATLATPTQAGLLRLDLPAALLRSSSISVDAEGNPIEHGTTWFAGDRVTLTLDAG